MTKSTYVDVLVDISEAAARLGMNQRKARLTLSRNLIRPVRTAQGIRYRLDDVFDVKRMHG